MSWLDDLKVEFEDAISGEHRKCYDNELSCESLDFIVEMIHEVEGKHESFESKVRRFGDLTETELLIARRLWEGASESDILEDTRIDRRSLRHIAVCVEKFYPVS